jgi:hypothetical protein
MQVNTQSHYSLGPSFLQSYTAFYAKSIDQNPIRPLKSGIQLWYSAACPLQFKKLEKRPFKLGQEKFEWGRPRPRVRRRTRRAPRHGPPGHARRGRLRSAGPCAVGRPCEPPYRCSPRAPRVHTRRADHPTATSSYARRAALGCYWPSRLCHRLVAPIPWTDVTPPQGTSAYKRS